MDVASGEQIAAYLMRLWEQTSASGAFDDQPRGRHVAVSANRPLTPVERPDEPGPWDKVQEALSGFPGLGFSCWAGLAGG
jgi:hypothetical protein